MDEKELAEKVESILDLRSKGGLGVMDWQAFGLMVEKAESMGWNILFQGDRIKFATRDNKEIDVWFTPTKEYSTQEHGHIKACALAFIEIPINTLSPQKDSQEIDGSQTIDHNREPWDQ